MPVISTIPNQITGFDTQGAVKQLLAVQQLQITQLKQKQTDQTDRQTALSTLNSDLSSFRQTAISMADPSRFFSYTASLASSNASVSANSLLSVSGTNAVAAGSHAIIVDQVAQSQRLSSASAALNQAGSAITDQTAVLGFTASSFQINGVTVNVAATDSLQDIQFAINQVNTGATATGVTASIVKVANNDFRLVLNADNTGSTGFTLSGAALNTGGALANLKLGSVASNTALASGATALNLTGSFTINGTTVNVAATDSLSGIAATINGLNIGVKASVRSFGASDFRLSLQGDKLAATPAKTITLAAGSGGVLAGLGLSGGSQTSLDLAADAKLNVDGLTITRASNKISDALPGVTFDLKQADANTTLTMNIGVDKADLRANVQSFVAGYNKVQDFINQQFVVDKKTGKNGVLASDSLLTTIQGQLSSSLLASVPGLASDRNSLVAIGIEPDKNGHLQINDNLFTTFLNSDVNAIRDVFTAQGSSVNSNLQFLINGLNTSSGTYTVNVTAAASKAVATAATLPALADTVTVTENGSLRKAVVSLTGAQTQTQVVDAFNAEFSTVRTEQQQMSAALNDTSTGKAATGASTFASLGANVAAGDTITIAGTNRVGAAVSGSFTVLDPATDTLSSLLSAIQSTFNQQVIASVDTGGHIVVTDTTGGDSQLAVNLTANNEGLGTLNFGADQTLTQGRYALGLVASASGSGVRIQSRNFGSASGFSIAESLNPAVFGAVTPGADVAGTIAGQTATGLGQVLTGASGNVDGLALMFSGSAPTTSGLMLKIGAASRLESSLDLFTNPVTGLIQNIIAASQGINTSLDQQIANLQQRMDQRRIQLTKRFARLAQSLSQLKSTSTFVTDQVNAGNAPAN